MVLPESILSIEEHLFRNCALLLNISLPSLIDFIHASAFEGCLYLKFENCNVIDSIIKKGVNMCDIQKLIRGMLRNTAPTDVLARNLNVVLVLQMVLVVKYRKDTARKCAASHWTNSWS